MACLSGLLRRKLARMEHWCVWQVKAPHIGASSARAPGPALIAITAATYAEDSDIMQPEASCDSISSEAMQDTSVLCLPRVSPLFSKRELAQTRMGFFGTCRLGAVLTADLLVVSL